MFKQGFSFSGFERDMVALNRGDGHYVDISGVSGADSITDGRSAVYADFDNDGDMDIFLRSVHGAAHQLYRNEIGNDNPFIRVALVGTKSGRDAFGAVVRLKTNRGVLTKIKSGGSGFISQSDPRLLFGLGTGRTIEAIEVTWPTGAVQTFDPPPAKSSIVITEGKPTYTQVQEKRFALVDPLGENAEAWRSVKLQPGQEKIDLMVQTLDGMFKDLPIKTTAGKPTVVNFWATWCDGCKRDMPGLEKLRNKANIVGVSIDGYEEIDLINKTIGKMGITYPNFVTEETELEKLYATKDFAVPLTVVLDANARVVDVFVGADADISGAVKKNTKPTTASRSATGRSK